MRPILWIALLAVCVLGQGKAAVRAESNDIATGNSDTQGATVRPGTRAEFKVKLAFPNNFVKCVTWSKDAVE